MVRKLGTPLLLLIVSVLLGACFKAEFKVVVNDNGSGAYKMAVGITHELSALANSQGNEDSANPIEKGQNKIAELGLTASVREWSDDQYEWMEASINFDTIDQLNTLGKEVGNFDRFTLQQEKGLLKNRFIFDGQFSTPDEEVNYEGGMFNPASFFDLKFIINLPGDIIETNGTVNPETGDISWKIDFNRKSSMHAVSESWNWFNIGAMTVSVGFLGIIVVAGGGLALLMVWKKNQSQSAPQAGQRSEKPDPPVAAKDLTVDDFLDSLVASSHTEEVLAEIDAENYLQQINQKLLKGRGEFEETSNGLRLTWPNGKEWVEVEVIDAERISINGKRHPATRKALNDGLIAALKTMNKIKGN